MKINNNIKVYYLKINLLLLKKSNNTREENIC